MLAPMVRPHLLALPAVLLFADCSASQRGRTSEPAPMSSATVASPASAHPSTLGCRSPEQHGCAKCCRPIEDGSTCTVMEWSGGDVTGVTPWYNSMGGANPCPPNCPPCAQCSARDEEKLRSADQTKCGCSGPPEPQACDVEGCGCYCSELYYLRMNCPHLAQ